MNILNVFGQRNHAQSKPCVEIAQADFNTALRVYDGGELDTVSTRHFTDAGNVRNWALRDQFAHGGQANCLEPIFGFVARECFPLELWRDRITKRACWAARLEKQVRGNR